MNEFNSFFALTAIIIGGLVGFVLAQVILALWRWMIRDTEKTRIKAAMLEEEYYNELYDEVLTEDIDKLARKAAKDMSKVRRRN